MVGMAPVDLGDSGEARQWVADAATVHGRVDVLFNNAAAPRFAAIAELTDEDWHFTIRNELDLIRILRTVCAHRLSAPRREVHQPGGRCEVPPAG
jgi:NAD(P)-dependent dehydrogenase (short-subunit alcohol dehydrogenase family)